MECCYPWSSFTLGGPTDLADALLLHFTSLFSLFQHPFLPFKPGFPNLRKPRPLADDPKFRSYLGFFSDLFHLLMWLGDPLLFLGILRHFSECLLGPFLEDFVPLNRPENRARFPPPSWFLLIVVLPLSKNNTGLRRITFFLCPLLIVAQ